MDLMTANVLAAGALQVAGIATAPLVPGLIQAIKGRLQGRRGPSPLQPYRELRRLWTRSRVTPEPRSLVYELAPPVVAASLVLALLVLPVLNRAPDWGIGHDAVVLVGLLALARFAVTLSAWDTGNGFALMGAARDLTFTVFVEALLLVVIALVAVSAGTTDLAGMANAGASGAVWSEPVRWAAAGGLLLVILAETGRQPIDNPDTHLELTMVHEGPLLEYAGRDLALLHWSAAARHWLVLLLAAQVVLPHPGSAAARLAFVVAWIATIAIALAIIETAQAKMRILRVPVVFAGAVGLCLLGLFAQLLGVSA
jgi:formate hydrogenlyase subunit 4